MKVKKSAPIKTWREFGYKVRSQGCCLLDSLDSFSNFILVSGCQRSGTTVVARVIKKSADVTNIQLCEDDELSDALLLSGQVKIKNSGRYCFQVTYLNECWKEYKTIRSDYKLIWVIRNPYSVVYSMAYHWRNYAFNELFTYVGSTEMNWRDKKLYDMFGRHALSKLTKACMSYVAKNKQLLELKKWMSEDRLYIVDYDKFIDNKHEELDLLFKFLNLKYDFKSGEQIHAYSGRKHKNLNDKQRMIIKERCNAIYEKIIKIADH